MFTGDPAVRCLVSIDRRCYSQQTYDLADGASRAGIPIIMFIGKFCDWIRKFSNHVIAVTTEVELFWNSHVALGCASNLLVNEMIGMLGAKVEGRLDQLSALYQGYTGHVGTSDPRRGRN